MAPEFNIDTRNLPPVRSLHRWPTLTSATVSSLEQRFNIANGLHRAAGEGYQNQIEACYVRMNNMKVLEIYGHVFRIGGLLRLSPHPSVAPVIGSAADFSTEFMAGDQFKKNGATINRIFPNYLLTTEVNGVKMQK